MNIHKIGGRAQFLTNKGYVKGEVLSNNYRNDYLLTIIKDDDGNVINVQRPFTKHAELILKKQSDSL